MQINCINMEAFNKTISILKSKGFRITKARKAILATFLKENTPLSIEEICLILTKRAVFVNKTTVYREIAFLEKLDIVKELNFGERKKRYELKNNHHHHLICDKCKKVSMVTSTKLENAINNLEKKLKKDSNFHSIRHSLEFFGVCSNCS